MQAKRSSTTQSNQASRKSVSDYVTEYLNEDRRRMVAEAAYFHAQQHSFQGGNIDEDWFRAEAEIDAMLTNTKTYQPTAGDSVSDIKNS